jgi:hypothetical protein
MVIGVSFYDTVQGLAFQISVAYWAIVRSLENLPEPATFKIALRAHARVKILPREFRKAHRQNRRC